MLIKVLSIFLTIYLCGTVVYSSCTPSSTFNGYQFQGCWGMYKRESYSVCWTSGSWGVLCQPTTTSGNGACGMRTNCGGGAQYVEGCWPYFYTPVITYGCWSQRVINAKITCYTVPCVDTQTRQDCDCSPDGPGITYQMAGPGACNRC